MNNSHIHFSFEKISQGYPVWNLRFHSYFGLRIKLNHVLKKDGGKLFKDLQTNKIFSRQILSWNLTGTGIPRLEISDSSDLLLSN